MAEKSILEQALLQVESLEEAVKQNSKGILGSVLKQELNGLLKESMEKEEKESSDVEEQDDEDTKPEQDTEDMEDDDTSSDDENLDKDIDAADSDMSDDDMSDDDMPSDDMSDDDMPSDDSVMDMTGASDDEVLKVFKAMKPEDGIVVKKDGNNLDIEIDGNEYVIKLDELDEEMDEEMDETSLEEDEDATDEETVYEIELDDEDVEDDGKKVETKEAKVEAPYKSTKSGKKVEATEAARTKWNPHGDKGGSNRTGLKSKKMFKAGSGSINEEVTKLRKQNDEYKKALVLFKEKLNEVAVFNASLAYSTRLFTEHSTTKQEKLNILKRFDSISTMNESKNLYHTIKAELDTKKPVTESVVDKISSTVKTSSSKEVLSEAKAYENPQFKRMKELMSKIK